MTIGKQRQKSVTPENIMRIIWAGTETISLSTAVHFDLFTHIANGKNTARELARTTKCSANSIERLLNVLVAMQLLNKDNKIYSLTPESDAFLVRDKGYYLGGMVKHGQDVLEGWKNLPKSIETGKSSFQFDSQKQGEAFFGDLVKALFPPNFAVSSAAASLFKKKKKELNKILDVAAGAAAWSLGFAKQYPEANVTALDFPGVLNVARQYIEQLGAQSQYDYLSGDLNTISFGKNTYDLIILGHICHSEGERRARKLIKKSAQALKEGGILLIAEVFPNEDLSAPLSALLFSLNMLVFTSEGDVFPISQYQKWLEEAGLKDFEVLDKLPSPFPLLLATK
ncbi:MAG: methyltransferase domain-containing protein [Acidobacteria bacterium]|nr:methyltransferase domain-containing protein [Acidobacteriota bacterium]